jgi:hypothetical protein
MDFIYITLSNSYKIKNSEKDKSNEIDSKKSSDRDEPDKLKIGRREKILNQYLHKFLEYNFNIKITNKNEEDYIKKFFEENSKIKLLYELIKYKKIEDKGEYYESIKQLIEGIKEDIINKNIEKQKLEEFLKNDEDTIKQRLNIIKFMLKGFDSNDTYSELKDQLERINKEIDILKDTKDNIQLYFPEDRKKLIIELKENIKESENKKIIDFNEGGTIFECIQKCKNKEISDDVDYIKKVKNFSLFKILYDLNPGSNKTKFDNAKKSLEKIGKLIKENNMNKLYQEQDQKEHYGFLDKTISKLRKNEEEDRVFIGELTKFYKIKDEELKDNLTILFRSERYKYNINSRIFFFDCLNNKNERWQNKDWNSKLSEYKDLSIKDFDKIKEKLLELNIDHPTIEIETEDDEFIIHGLPSRYQ